MYSERQKRLEAIKSNPRKLNMKKKVKVKNIVEEDEEESDDERVRKEIWP